MLWAGDRHTDKDWRQRSPHLTHAHTRPDIDMEAEEGGRKGEKKKEAEEERGMGLRRRGPGRGLVANCRRPGGW